MKRFICVIFLIVISQVIGSQKNHKAGDDNFLIFFFFYWIFFINFYFLALLFTARNLNSQLKNFLEDDLRNIMRNNEPILDPYNSNEQIMEYDDGTLMSVFLF